MDRLEQFRKKQQTVSEGIIKAFKDQFHEEPEADFETCWPVTCWDVIRTETRTFLVKLKMSTGKVEYIQEEF